MSLRIRRFFFYTFIILFVLLSTGVVFYARGWRFDLTGFAFKKVGAIFVRSFPTDAKIYLNGQSVKNDSWFFQNGTFINNLFPKTYSLSLTAPGYKDWNEKIIVQPMLVSEAKYAVLIPVDTVSVPGVLDGISDFKIINGELVLKNASGTWLWRGQALPGTEMLGSTNDNKKNLTKDSVKNIYYWTDLNSFSTMNLTTILRRLGVPTQNISVIINPNDSQKILVRTSQKLWLVEPQTPKASALESIAPNAKSSSSTLGAAIAPNRFLVAWTEFNEQTNSSTLIVYDTALKTRLSNSPSFSGKTKKISWATNDTLAVLQDDGALSLYAPSQNNLLQTTTGVKDFLANDAGTRLAVLKDNQIMILSLAGNDDDYRLFRLPQQGVQKLEWYVDNYHLFVHYNGYINFLDLEDRSLQNFLTVVKATNADYDAKNNILYFITDGKLVSLDFSKG